MLTFNDTSEPSSLGNFAIALTLTGLALPTKSVFGIKLTSPVVGSIVYTPSSVVTVVTSDCVAGSISLYSLSVVFSGWPFANLSVIFSVCLVFLIPDDLSGAETTI